MKHNQYKRIAEVVHVFHVWQLTAACNYSFRGSDAIFLAFMGTFTEVACTHSICTHRHKIKIMIIRGSLRCLHWIKALGIKSEDPGSIPEPQMVE